MVQVSESLAGRLSIVELTPFLWTELKAKISSERQWLCGGYPDGGVLAPKRFPRWQLDYLALLSQRDLPTWGLSAKPQTTDRFLRSLRFDRSNPTKVVGGSKGLRPSILSGWVRFDMPHSFCGMVIP
jgi:predicted AAA+ superfamily ATPase